MNYKKLNKLILASLIAAMICASALLIHLPVPGGNGYLNISDAFCILAGILLGPVYGGIAAALGSSICDLALGYAFYIPATAVIKGIVAVIAFFAAKKLGKRKYISYVTASIFAEAVMPPLYFLYEYFVLGYNMSALGNLGFNFMQGAVSALLAVLILAALGKANLIEKLNPDKN